MSIVAKLRGFAQNLFQALSDQNNACLRDIEVANDQPFHPQTNAKLVVIEKFFDEDLYLALNRPVTILAAKIQQKFEPSLWVKSFLSISWFAFDRVLFA